MRARAAVGQIAAAAGLALAIAAVLSCLPGAPTAGSHPPQAHASPAAPTLHESTLRLAGYPLVGGTTDLVFNVTYSAAAAAPPDGPPPVRLDVTGSEYPHLYRVHNTTSNVGSPDPAAFSPYDHSTEDTLAADGATYTVRATLEVLSAGVIPVYARGLDGDIVTVHVAASELVSMPYEAYVATGQTYLDAVYGRGGGASGQAPGAQAGAAMPGAGQQPQQQQSPSFPPMASVRLDPSARPVQVAAPPAGAGSQAAAGSTAPPPTGMRLPASAVPALAPPQYEAAGGGARGGSAPLAQGVQPYPPHFDVSGTVWAEGNAAGDLVPARNIQVCVYHYRSGTLYPMSTAAGGYDSACTFTDGNGTYRVGGIVNDDPFDSSAADPIPVLYSRGPDGLEVAAANFRLYFNTTFWYSNAGGDIAHDFVLGPAPSGAARVINAMSDAREFFDGYGLAREPLYVRWQHDAGASAFPPFYTNGAKSWRTFIWLDGESDSTIDDTLYPHTLLHEFGHYAAYVGGVLNDYSCPVHRIYLKNTPGCAWGEGWANYVPHMVYDSTVMLRTAALAYDAEAAVVRIAATGAILRPFDATEPPSRHIGDRVEGRVTAALWDMADAHADPVHDAGGPGRPLAYDGMAAGHGPIVEAVLAGTYDSMAEFYGAWEDGHYLDSAEAVMRLHGMSFAIPNTAKYYMHAGSFGGNGSGPGQMLYPLDVDVAPDGSVLVADTANSRVQVFGAGGAYAGQFGSNGSGDGNLLLPAGVASNGTHAFVADALNARVEVFSAADRSHAGRVDGYGDGRRLGMPTAVAANSTHLLVSDSDNYSIGILRHGEQLADAFRKTGDPAAWAADLAASARILDSHLAWYGLNGSGLALSYRTAIAPDGTIAITDFAFPTINKFPPGGSREVVVPRGALAGDRVSAVDFDSLGRTVSSEWTRGLVRVIDGNGTLIDEFGGLGRGAGEFSGLAGIAVGGTGRIYAADAYNDRVQMFDLDRERPEAFHVWARPQGANATAGPYGNATTATPTSVSAPGSVYIAVEFTEPVTVDASGGIPVLDLDTGGGAGGGHVDGRAVYMSGSGSDTLTFEYVVDARDSAARLSYKSSGSLRAYGASIIDGSGNVADLDLAEPGSPGSLSNSSNVRVVPGSPQPGPPGGLDPDALHLRCLMHPLLCRY